MSLSYFASFVRLLLLRSADEFVRVHNPLFQVVMRVEVNLALILLAASMLAV